MTAPGGLATAMRTPVPGGHEADIDLLNLPMETSNAHQSSPKRTRWDLPQPGLTLDDLTKALAPLAGTLQTLTQRMESVEDQVTNKVGQALDLIRTVDTRQKEMTKQLDEVQNAVTNQSRRSQEQDKAISDVIRRLEAIEQQGQGGVWQHVGQASGDDRGPALILGGWRSDSEAENVLQQAREFAKDQGLQVNMADAFVPGRNNGFVVVPLVGQPGETPQATTRRAISAIETVRKLQHKTGHKDDKGKELVVWMALSQPPEIRRRTRTTAKTKRAILESSEKSGQAVKADYRRGSVFIEGSKVAGSGPLVRSLSPTMGGWMRRLYAGEPRK